MAKNFVSNLIIRTKDETTAVVNRVGGAFKSLGGIVAGVAAGLATAFSVRSISSFLTGATKEAGEFGKQIAIVGNISGATGEDLAKLRATAEQLGSSTAFSASEAAQGMEALARAGLNAEQTISTIPSVLALAQGQSLELGQAASIITQSLAGMGLAVDQAGRAADVLAKGAQSANTTVEGLGSALSFAAPAANALGIELEDTVAMIGKLADSGIDAGRAGTALSNIFLQFKDPASQFRNELRAIGIDTEDFSAALAQLEKAGAGGEKALLSLGQRGGPALRILVSQGADAIGELTQQLREAEGTAQSAADTIANTLPGAFDGLRSAWESLRLSLGDALIEPVTRQVTALANKIREFVNSDSIDKLKAALVEGFENGVIAIKEFVAQFGTVEQMATRVTTAISTTSQSFAMLGTAGRAAGNAIMAVFQAVNTVISGLALGISAIVTQIIGVVNILVQSLNAIGMATDSIAMKSQAALETMQDMNVELVKRTVQAAKDSATALGNMVSAIGDLETGAGRAGTKVADLGTELGNAVANTESAAEAVTRLKGEVEFLTADIDALIESGAGMDLINQKFQELGEAQAKLESAQAAAELEQLAAAATDAGNAASGAAQGLTNMADVLRDGENAAVDVGAELVKLRKQYDEGKLSAQDYAAAVAGLAQNLQGLSIEQLSRESASLAQRFREGKISAEELRIGTDLVSKSMLSLAQSSREAAQAQAEVGESAKDVADKITINVGRSREAMTQWFKAVIDGGLKITSRWSEATVQLFQQLRGATQAANEMGDAQKLASGDVDALRDRLDALGQSIREVRQIQQTLSQGSLTRWAAQQSEAAYRAEQAYLRQRLAMEGIVETADRGALSMNRLNQITAGAESQFNLLNNADLGRLNTAIDAARSRMDALRDSSSDTLRTLQDELLQLQGNEEELANRRAVRREEELRAELSAAKAINDRESVAALEEALSTLRQIGREEARQRQERQREDEAKEQPRVEPVAQPQARGPVSINVGGVLDVNDRATLDSLARKLQPILRDIERRSA